MLRFDINVIFTIINILFLYWLLRRFLFRPVHRIMAQRKAEIDDLYAKAEKTGREAQAKKEEYQQKIKGAQDEAQKLISDSRASASAEYDHIVSEAKKQADDIVSGAKTRAQVQADRMKQESADEIEELARQAVSKIAADVSDEQLYDDFLNQNAPENDENKK